MRDHDNTTGSSEVSRDEPGSSDTVNDTVHPKPWALIVGDSNTDGLLSRICKEEGLNKLSLICFPRDGSTLFDLKPLGELSSLTDLHLNGNYSEEFLYDALSRFVLYCVGEDLSPLLL